MSDALRVALVGNPNCGKTSLFNHLTGTRQKVANYAGVTVERKVGHFQLPSGRNVRVLDLPGTYSLQATSPDEEISPLPLEKRFNFIMKYLQFHYLLTKKKSHFCDLKKYQLNF